MYVITLLALSLSSLLTAVSDTSEQQGEEEQRVQRRTAEVVHWNYSLCARYVPKDAGYLTDSGFQEAGAEFLDIVVPHAAVCSHVIRISRL
jgi:cytochrome b561